MGDAQGAFLLIRHCASFCKLVYSARAVPPAAHYPALEEFSGDLRKALEGILGDDMPELSWQQAQLGIVHGGLGLRGAAQHASAAFVSSVLASRELCQAIDADFEPDDASGGLGLQAAKDHLRSTILDAVAVDLEAVTSQKYLSKLVDAAAKDSLRQGQRNDAFFRAHLSLCSLPTAGAWLTAPPADDDRQMDSALFQLARRHRLRMPVYAAETFCPCSGEGTDRFGDHALVCPCQGDRTVRHNALRNLVYKDAVDAGMRPEREKAGLLPARPAEDGIKAGGDQRRPADVWLPRGPVGRPEALDFACTSGVRADVVAQTADTPNTVFDKYEEFKHNYKDTGQHCAGQGLQFTPMVVEAHSGAWSPNARAVLGRIATSLAAVWNDSIEETSLRMAQRLSIALHRANARAILKRADPIEGARVDAAWDECDDSLDD